MPSRAKGIASFLPCDVGPKESTQVFLWRATVIFFSNVSLSHLERESAKELCRISCTDAASSRHKCAGYSCRNASIQIVRGAI